MVAPTLSVRQSQIRQAAVLLFSERGYFGTGMEDIAAEVGLRASSLYNHVRSKQELLVAIMTETMRDLLDAYDEATQSGSASERLYAAMVAHVRYHGTHRNEAHIGNREIASLQEPDRTVVRKLRRQYARTWQRLIESGVADGSFTSTLSPQLTAYALLEMGIGVSQWYREKGPLALDEIARQYGEMALRQVGAVSGPPRSYSNG
jgi:AcrR family transcriptional regulator